MKIEEWEPETSGCGEAGNFPHVLAQKLRPSAVAEYDKAIGAVFSATAEVDNLWLAQLCTCTGLCVYYSLQNRSLLHIANSP